MHRAQIAGLVCIALFASSAARAQPTFSGLTYAVVGGQPLVLDLYLPQNAPQPYPVVVWIHGGGWAGGSRFPAGVAGLLTQAGFAVASVDYRLTSQAGQFGAQPVTFPAQIHDVKAAVRWLRANASQFDLDRSRFGSWGSSAGGHLSALLGTSGEVPSIEGSVGGNRQYTSLIHACVDYFGPTDLVNMMLDVTTPPGSNINHDAFNSPESHLIGWDDPGQGIGDIRANLANPNAPYPELVALCNAANPITHIGPNDPPFLIVHGTADPTVPTNQSVRLRDALTAVGVPNIFTPVEGAGHGGFGAATDQATVQWLVANLRLLPRVQADLDGDRRVSLSDLSILLSNFGGGIRGDVDYDGDTDLQDLSIVLAAFGS